jgi:type IV secretory pathway VirB9-like protein
MRAALAATSALVWIGSAHALQVPQPAVPLAKGGDPHIQVAICDMNQSTLVVGAVGRPVTIVFDPAETINKANLPSGVPDGSKAAVQPWQGEPGATGNVMPLWVMAAGRANAQVTTTTADHQTRVYSFALIALPPQPDDCQGVDCDDPRLTSTLTFKCPAEHQPPPVDWTAVRARAEAKAKLDAEARLKTDIFAGERNWRYQVKGQPDAIKDLAPNQVSDNTQVTGFLYLGNRQSPSLYIVDAGNTERQVTPTPDKDLLVVYETAAHWRLRKGSEVVDLINVGYDDIGANPYTGTTSPNVIRTIRTTTAK